MWTERVGKNVWYNIFTVYHNDDRFDNFVFSVGCFPLQNSVFFCRRHILRIKFALYTRRADNFLLFITNILHVCKHFDVEEYLNHYVHWIFHAWQMTIRNECRRIATVSLLHTSGDTVCRRAYQNLNPPGTLRGGIFLLHVNSKLRSKNQYIYTFWDMPIIIVWLFNFSVRFQITL